jgi:hypothetical protein
MRWLLASQVALQHRGVSGHHWSVARQVYRMQQVQDCALLASGAGAGGNCAESAGGASGVVDDQEVQAAALTWWSNGRNMH